MVRRLRSGSSLLLFGSECYTEKCVMNNYFGIGLDAKISLDFNNKRDEHPEKCRWVWLWLLPEVMEMTSCFCAVLEPILYKCAEQLYHQYCLHNPPSRFEIMMEDISY